MKKKDFPDFEAALERSGIKIRRRTKKTPRYSESGEIEWARAGGELLSQMAIRVVLALTGPSDNPYILKMSDA